jgi:ribosomal protein L11 methyltransferase
MPCEEIVIHCPPETAPYLVERLWGLDCLQSVMEDIREEQVIGIRAYSLDSTEQADAAEVAWGAIGQLLASEPAFAPAQLVSRQAIADEAWAESWKQFWHVQHLTDTLTIRPSWEPYTPSRPDEVVIELDPGNAFGTGTHATTRLMLIQLSALAQEIDFAAVSVLDVGTGSGILAIYAAKLGCRTVMAVDNDPAATETTLANATANGVAAALTVSTTPLGELCRTRYEVVLANIIAPVILDLLPDMLDRLAPNGVILLSGLIETTVGPVSEALRAAGVTDVVTQQQGDWFAVRGRGPGR